MEIQITGRNVEITEAIRKYIHAKFGKLPTYFQNITNIHVILNIGKKFQHDAEAHIDLSHGNIFAKSTSKDLYSSIDLLIDKIDKQVVKHKEELKNHKTKTGRSGFNTELPDTLE